MHRGITWYFLSVSESVDHTTHVGVSLMAYSIIQIEDQCSKVPRDTRETLKMEYKQLTKSPYVKFQNQIFKIQNK